ncbi:iron-sulfur cluster insertion protein ErpA [bacterium]|nr:iron-sulfur cluster insertion protein ErpA [bacterium]NUN44491.1 iron-sulfur cluster insertion protein ErpA [bacterium]
MTETMEAVNDVVITQRAIEEIGSIMREQSIPENYTLRMGVQGGGCSGFQYSLAFDETISENDTILEFGAVKVAVDYKSMLYLKGVTLDFQDGLNGRGFVFNNPNAKKTCGCGSSFSA